MMRALAARRVRSRRSGVRRQEDRRRVFRTYVGVMKCFQNVVGAGNELVAIEPAEARRLDAH